MLEIGSPGRTRTCDQPVTSAPVFRPGLDYLITRLTDREGCRALVRPYRVGSSASSLCTFLPTFVLRHAQDRPFGRLRSGFSFRQCGDGFPEFTRCFTHSFPWGLQSGVHFSMAGSVLLRRVPSFLQPAALPTELPGNIAQQRWRYSNTGGGQQGERFLTAREVPR